MQAEVEAFGVVEEGEQDVVGVAAVLPEAETAGSHSAGGAVGAGDEVCAAEEMHEEIAGDAGGVVLPLAPLEEALGGERDFGGCAFEARPIAGFGGGVERDGVVPGADGGVAVPAGGDHVELADGAGGEELFGLGVDDGADALAANLENTVGGVGGFDDLRAVGVDVDHRLFEVDVLAGLHGVDGGALVPVVGRGDEDGVDVFAGEDFVVVAGGEDVLAPELFGVGEAAVVAVGDGNQLDAGDLEGSCGIALALDAGADEGEVDGVGSGRCGGGRGLGEKGLKAGRGGGKGGGLGGGLEEASAVEVCDGVSLSRTGMGSSRLRDEL